MVLGTVGSKATTAQALPVSCPVLDGVQDEVLDKVWHLAVAFAWAHLWFPKHAHFFKGAIHKPGAHGL